MYIPAENVDKRLTSMIFPDEVRVRFTFLGSLQVWFVCMLGRSKCNLNLGTVEKGFESLANATEGAKSNDT
jgi:hypothetical protein